MWIETFLSIHHFDGWYTYGNGKFIFDFVAQFVHPKDSWTLVATFYDEDGAIFDMNGNFINILQPKWGETNKILVRIPLALSFVICIVWCMQYIKCHFADFIPNLHRYSVTLGHEKKLIRFWCSWLIFKWVLDKKCQIELFKPELYLQNCWIDLNHICLSDVNLGMLQQSFWGNATLS